MPCPANFSIVSPLIVTLPATPENASGAVLISTTCPVGLSARYTTPVVLSQNHLPGATSLRAGIRCKSLLSMKRSSERSQAGNPVEHLQGPEAQTGFT